MKKLLTQLFLVISLCFLLCFSISCQDKEARAELEAMKAQAEVEEQNKEIVHRFFEEVWGLKKLDVIDEIFATDYVGHMTDSPDILGSEGLKQYVTMMCISFPDIKPTVEAQVAEGDKVIARWTTAGTHKGELMNIPPTGVQATWTGISFFRIVGGKIVERWKNMDTLGMMQQLGMELKPKEAEKQQY